MPWAGPGCPTSTAVHLEVTEDGDVTVGERISLVDPTHTVPIESDRI